MIYIYSVPEEDACSSSGSYMFRRSSSNSRSGICETNGSRSSENFASYSNEINNSYACSRTDFNNISRSRSKKMLFKGDIK